MFPFDLQANFSNQHQLIKDSDTEEEMPYGVWKFNQIIKECYFISDNIHTSYTDLLNISVKEKDLLIKYINEKNKAERDAIEKAKKKK